MFGTIRPRPDGGNSRRLRRLLVLTTVLVCTITAAEALSETRVSVRDRTAVGLADGDVQWRLRHPTGWKLDEFRLVDDVRFQGRTFYGVGPDLVEVDPEIGHIENRWRFPARIDEIAAGNEALEVTVAVPAADDRETDEFAPTETVTLSYRPGEPVPGRGFWSIANFEHMASAFEAQSLTAESASDDDPSDADRFEFLGRRWRRDQTNPLIALRRAELAKQMGDETFADSLFETAADTEAIHWFDELLMWAMLEEHGRAELADQVYDRARRTMERRGIRPLRLTHQLLPLSVHGEFKSTVEKAIDRGDVGKVDRTVGRLSEVFPRFEGAQPAWSFLADWSTSRSSAAAERWQKRAERSQSAVEWHRFNEWAPAAGFWTIWIYALVLGLLVGGLALGLRPRPADSSSGERRTWSWFAAPTRGGVAGLVVCAGLCLPVSTSLLRANHKVSASTIAPDGVSTEGYGSPAVVDWLERQPDSEPRDAFLAYARSELKAAKRGARPESSGPDQGRLVDLYEATAGERFGWFSSAEIRSKPPGSIGLVDRFGSFSAALLGALGAAALAFLIGRALARFLPSASRWIRRGLPGAMAPHRLLVAPCVAAFAAAVVALVFEVDTMYVDLMEVGQVALVQFFRSNATDSLADPIPSRHWAWSLLVIVVVLHGVGLWREYHDEE